MFMNKKLLIQILATTQYVFLVAATVAVLTFQFIPSIYCVLTALICYCLGFFVMSTRAVANLVEIIIASKRVKEENSSLVTEGTKEVLNSKSELSHSIISSLIWLACFGFSLAVTISYMLSI